MLLLLLLFINKIALQKLYKSSRWRFWELEFSVLGVDSSTGDWCTRDGVAGEGVPAGECWPNGDGEYCLPRDQTELWGDRGPIVVVLPANNKKIEKLIYMHIKSIELRKNKQFTQL